MTRSRPSSEPRRNDAARSGRSLLIALCLCAPSLADVGRAAAQERPATDEFSVQRFWPSPGENTFLSVDGARTPGHIRPTLGLSIDYANQPFTLYDATCSDSDANDCEVGDVETKLVEHAVTGNLHFALTLIDRLQVAIVVPASWSTGDAFAYTPTGDSRPVVVGGRSGISLGDPRLHLKASLLERGALAVGVAAFATAPVGQATSEGSFAGDDGPTFGGHGIVSFDERRLHLGANIGASWRRSGTLFSTETGAQFYYRAGVGFDATPLLLVFGEVEGGTSFSSQIDENPLEGRLGAKLRQGDFSFVLAGGGGVLAGAGIPRFRALGAVTWTPGSETEPTCVRDAAGQCVGANDMDQDGDGLADDVDQCPNEPEDADGRHDDDGCPDLDDDGDGIPDGYDSCPLEPEDMDGDRDDDGCPDDDTDRDGIADAQDRCPNEAEDTDGFGDDDGCPEVDFDRDGIPDDSDECPEQPEIMNGVLDNDGCPEPDSDNDGIPDEADRCPNEAETLNGVRDTDGCPDGDALVMQEGNEIRLLQQVQFQTNKAKIRGRRSFQILDAVATILARNPQFTVVRVEGHTDDRGDRQRNLDLSRDRAQACVDYLVRKGVEPNRLTAVGHGPDRPLQDNATDQGRTANRRVEFHIENAPPGAAAPSAAETGAAPAGDGTTSAPSAP